SRKTNGGRRNGHLARNVFAATVPAGEGNAFAAPANASPMAESPRVRTQVIDAKTHSRAPREVVWSILADGGSWSEWGPWTKSELDRVGSPPPGGVGSIKRLARGRMTIREEVTEFEPPSRFGYRLL